jgi:hypothetical protein
LRFVVLETENGYAFALASYAPDTDEMHSVVAKESARNICVCVYVCVCLQPLAREYVIST